MSQIELANKAGLVHPNDPAFMPNLQPEPPADPLRGIKVALEALKKNPKASQATIDYLTKLVDKRSQELKKPNELKI